MKAVCWEGTDNITVERVPDPAILNPRDAIVRVTSTAICGSDRHLMDGFRPTRKAGDILGHEFMGEVVDIGRSVSNLRKGDRVIVPFAIACGHCYFCRNEMWAVCDNSNPNAEMAEKLYGYSGAGLFGYSHLYGGYAGGQAEWDTAAPVQGPGAVEIVETRGPLGVAGDDEPDPPRRRLLQVRGWVEVA